MFLIKIPRHLDDGCPGSQWSSGSHHGHGHGHGHDDDDDDDDDDDVKASHSSGSTKFLIKTMGLLRL